MADSDFRVVVIPCNGIGRLASTITRQAGYRLEQLRPGQVILLGAAALAVGEEEALKAFKNYPVLVIDGCRPHCATVLANELGKKPAAAIYCADVAAQTKISLSGEKRRKLGKRALELTEAIAQKCAEEVDKIVAEEMMSTL
jgi:uncharacterized metal-binding protein